MAKRGGIHEHRGMSSVARRIASLQEEKIAHHNIWLHDLDDLHTALIDIDILFLIPSPDILDQGLETQDSSCGTRGMKCPALAGAEEHICIRGPTNGMEMNARVE